MGYLFPRLLACQASCKQLLLQPHSQLVKLLLDSQEEAAPLRFYSNFHRVLIPIYQLPASVLIHCVPSSFTDKASPPSGTVDLMTSVIHPGTSFQKFCHPIFSISRFFLSIELIPPTYITLLLLFIPSYKMSFLDTTSLSRYCPLKYLLTRIST